MARTRNELPTGQFHVKIVRSDHEYVTRDRNPEDEWDGDDISHDHTIEGFEVVGNSAEGDFVLTEKPEGNWYLVCAFYSTGDSFHCEENCLSLVSFVKDAEDAKEILDAIELDYKRYHEKQEHNYKPLQVLLPKANRIEEIYTGTWKGYFERLNSAEVRCLSGGAHKVVFNARRRY